jgi:hypothetical protein
LDVRRTGASPGLHQVAIRLGEPEPGVDANAISRWERGVVRPSRRYALLLCLLFDLPPEHLGLVATPWLLGEYARLRADRDAERISQRTIVTAASASRARASRIAHTLLDRYEATLPYRPHLGFDRELRDFLTSSSRVLLVAGSLGVGKTTICCHVVDSFPAGTAVQLHLVQHIDRSSFGLAASILRYADVPIGSNDPLQLVSRLLDESTETWLVVVDGISDAIQWRWLGKELDLVLSHIGNPRLRFLVTHRSGLDFSISEFPILSVLTFRPFRGSRSRTSAAYRLDPWSGSDAQRIWDAGRGEGVPAFTALPQPLQHLLRWPLHMRLARETVSETATDLSQIPSSFELVDTSVHAALDRVGAGAEAGLVAMQALAATIYDREFNVRAEPLQGDLQPTEADLVSVVDAELAIAVDRGGRRRVAFAHDLFAEYSLALTSIQEVLDQADPMNGLRLLSRLARSAETSGTAQGALELTVLGVASKHAEVWRQMMAVLHRRVSTEVTLCLPTIVRLHCRGTRLLEATDVENLLAVSASRPKQRLAQSLLDCPVLVNDLPAPIVARWLLDLVRIFGPVLWWEILSFLNGLALTQPMAATLLATADMNDPDESRLIAHLAPRMGRDDPEVIRTLS